jgi:predicted ABC-type sugar transport system permease subunit
MTDAAQSAHAEGFLVRARHLGVFSQKSIVFAIFIVLFIVLSVSVPSFLSLPNLLTLLQSVAILGILGLGMNVVVIGRGIDISMIAILVVPPGILLQRHCHIWQEEAPSPRPAEFLSH